MEKSTEYCSKNILFCADHFEPSMFMNDKRNRLIKTAVPTLFVNKNTLKPGKKLEKMHTMNSQKGARNLTEIVTENDFDD